MVKLNSLPKFIKYKIFAYLSLKTIIFWQRTSKSWHEFLTQTQFWLFKLKHDYPKFSIDKLKPDLYFNVVKALTLKFGHLHKIVNDNNSVCRYEFPYDLKQLQIRNYIRQSHGSDYILDENGYLCLRRKHGIYWQGMVDTYVEQFYKESELDKPFLKNIENIVSMDNVSYLLTTHGHLYELKSTPTCQVPNDIFLKPGSNFIVPTLINTSTRELGRMNFRPISYIWYLTYQNVLYINTDEKGGYTSKIENVLHVTFDTSSSESLDRDTVLYFANTDSVIYNIKYIERDLRPNKVYCHTISPVGQFHLTQFVVQKEYIYMIDSANILHIININSNCQDALPDYVKLFKCICTNQTYGLKSNLDLICLSDMSLIAHNVVNCITSEYTIRVLILPTDYWT